MTAPIRILNVDDDAASRYVKSRVLRQNGYTVVEAASGREAIEQVTTSLPDLVLLDTRLGDISGFDVSGEIKARFPLCPVLQTSAAFTNAADRARALDDGADAYLVEPIEPIELLATIRALLRIGRAERELKRVNDNLELIISERTREVENANRRLMMEMSDRSSAEATLWQTQKLDLIGRFTGGIAHDFNNLLMVISGSLELLRSELGAAAKSPAGRLSRMLDRAQTATDHAAGITRQLLTFTRRSTKISVPVRLSETMAHLQNLVKPAIGETIELTIGCSRDLWWCAIDPNQLEASVLNLAVNARDAMPRGGKLLVTATNIKVDGARGAAARGVAPGEYVQLSVSDTGTGMAPTIIDQIFEPFFTTKPVGEGSGLGLSQVYGFVTQSTGHILVDSKVGAGTTFRLFFPRIADGSAAASQAVEREDDREGRFSGTALVVDDNKEVRDVAIALIVGLGYDVVSASNGREAIDLIESGAELELMLTDIVMPGGIDGFELARRARALRPALPILMMSGYPPRPPANFDVRDFQILQKPYRGDDLARHIRMALSRV